jgi:hypothetical protein
MSSAGLLGFMQAANRILALIAIYFRATPLAIFPAFSYTVGGQAIGGHMKKTHINRLAAGMIIALMGAACLCSQESENDLAWKRLKKLRVRAGVMIGKGRPNYTEAYVRLTDVRAMLEDAGVPEPVTILLFADYGTKLFLGTYAPVLTPDPAGGTKVTFPTIPNAFLVTRAFSYNVGDLYPFQFLDGNGKVRATIRIKLMGQVDQTF